MLKILVRVQMGYLIYREMQVDHEMEVVVAHPLAIPSNVLVLDNPLVERLPMLVEMVPTIH